MKKAWYTAIVLLLLISVAIIPAEAEHNKEQLNVFVSILPQKHFVEQIAGDRVNVNVMVAPGSHPATYEPAARRMAALSECDLYFAIGVPFEKAWMEKIRSANPNMRIVYTDAWIKKQPIGRHSHESRSPGSDDPHIWLSPPLVMLQARHIVRALTEADPQNKDFYESGYREFISKTAALDKKLRELFPPNKSTPEFLVFHPSWGYFADAYGLKQIAVETDGKSPKPAEIKQLITHARKRKIRAVLVQPKISARTAEMIAREIDGKTLPADPLAENWRENLLEVAKQIRRAAR
ncbi:MAG: zinc ABC transporter substrate-binding protein [Desulfobacteraceae bacterium]|nr:zinc ABC transporter substrate-binding protein [Desulfobacteraceae bacterium]